MTRGLRHPVGLSLWAMVALLASVPLYVQVFFDLGLPPVVRLLLLFYLGVALAVVVTPAMLVAALILAWWRSRGA